MILERSAACTLNIISNGTHMRTNIALQAVLVHLVMLESLRPVKITVAVATIKSFHVAVR